MRTQKLNIKRKPLIAEACRTLLTYLNTWQGLYTIQ